MHEFDPGGTAVGISQDSENFAQGGFGWCEIFCRENAVEIGFFKTEGLQAEKRMFSFTWCEGICAGVKVPDIAVSVDEHLHCGNFPGCFRIGRRSLSVQMSMPLFPNR